MADCGRSLGGGGAGACLCCCRRSRQGSRLRTVRHGWQHNKRGRQGSRWRSRQRRCQPCCSSARGGGGSRQAPLLLGSRLQSCSSAHCALDDAVRACALRACGASAEPGARAPAGATARGGNGARNACRSVAWRAAQSSAPQPQKVLLCGKNAGLLAGKTRCHDARPPQNFSLFSCILVAILRSPSVMASSFLVPAFMGTLASTNSVPPIGTSGPILSPSGNLKVCLLLCVLLQGGITATPRALYALTSALVLKGRTILQENLEHLQRVLVLHDPLDPTNALAKDSFRGELSRDLEILCRRQTDFQRLVECERKGTLFTYASMDKDKGSNDLGIGAVLLLCSLLKCSASVLYDKTEFAAYNTVTVDNKAPGATSARMFFAWSHAHYHHRENHRLAQGYADRLRDICSRTPSHGHDHLAAAGASPAAPSSQYFEVVQRPGVPSGSSSGGAAPAPAPAAPRDRDAAPAAAAAGAGRGVGGAARGAPALAAPSAPAAAALRGRGPAAGAAGAGAGGGAAGAAQPGAPAPASAAPSAPAAAAPRGGGLAAGTGGAGAGGGAVGAAQPGAPAPASAAPSAPAAAAPRGGYAGAAPPSRTLRPASTAGSAHAAASTGSSGSSTISIDMRSLALALKAFGTGYTGELPKEIADLADILRYTIRNECRVLTSLTGHAFSKTSFMPYVVGLSTLQAVRHSCTAFEKQQQHQQQHQHQHDAAPAPCTGLVCPLPGCAATPLCASQSCPACCACTQCNQRVQQTLLRIMAMATPSIPSPPPPAPPHPAAPSASPAPSIEEEPATTAPAAAPPSTTPSAPLEFDWDSAFDSESDSGSVSSEGSEGGGAPPTDPTSASVTPVSTQIHLAAEYCEMVYKCIRVFSLPTHPEACESCAVAQECRCAGRGVIMFAAFPNAVIGSIAGSGSASSASASSAAGGGSGSLEMHSGAGWVCVRLPVTSQALLSASPSLVSPLCSACATHSHSGITVSAPCIHTAMLQHHFSTTSPADTNFPFPYTVLEGPSAPAQAAASSPAAKRPRVSVAEKRTTRQHTSLAFMLPSFQHHLNICVIPLHFCSDSLRFAPVVVKVPKNNARSSRSSRSAKCPACATGSSYCVHAVDGLEAARELGEPVTRQRTSELSKPCQSTATWDFSLQSGGIFPVPCTLPVGDLHPGNGGGTFAQCPDCASAFDTTPLLQCNLHILQLDAQGTQVTEIVRRMFYFSCSRAGCPGRQYYCGRDHGVTVLTPPPCRRGKKMRRAFGFSLQTLATFLRAGATSAWSDVFNTFFKNAAYPSRQIFTTAMFRAIGYIAERAALPALGLSAVIDVTHCAAPASRQVLGGSTSFSPPHVCLTGPLGDVVNPAHPVFGLPGDWLTWLPPGLQKLATGLSVDSVRDFFLRLALNAAQNRRAGSALRSALGWGTFSGSTSKGVEVSGAVTCGELHTMCAKLRDFCTGVLAAPDLDSTLTAVTLAKNLLAALPLLESFSPCAWTDLQADAAVKVPSIYLQVLASLHSPAVHSAVARLPALGRYFFPNLVAHLRGGGGINERIPENVLQLLPHLRSAMWPFEDASSFIVPWLQAAIFFAPELHEPLVAAASPGDIAPLLPLLTRYGELAARVDTYDIHVLIATPVTGKGSAVFRPFGADLTSEYDRLRRYALPLRDALEVPFHAHHKSVAQDILEALEFEEREGDSRQRDFQCGLHVPSFTFLRRRRVHYYNTHNYKLESSSCVNCHKTCTSPHCDRNAEEETIEGGCSHNYGTHGYLGGTLNICSPETGALHGFNTLQHRESLHYYFLLFNYYSTARPAPWAAAGPRGLGHPFFVLFDSACQFMSYALRRNPQRFKWFLAFVDSLHSKNHKVSACQPHLHAPLWRALFPFVKKLYESAAEGRHSHKHNMHLATSSLPMRHAAQVADAAHYNDALSQRAPITSGPAPLPQKKIAKGFPLPDSDAVRKALRSHLPVAVPLVHGAAPPTGAHVPFGVHLTMYLPAPRAESAVQAPPALKLFTASQPISRADRALMDAHGSAAQLHCLPIAVVAACAAEQGSSATAGAAPLPDLQQAFAWVASTRTVTVASLALVRQLVEGAAAPHATRATTLQASQHPHLAQDLSDLALQDDKPPTPLFACWFDSEHDYCLVFLSPRHRRLLFGFVLCAELDAPRRQHAEAAAAQVHQRLTRCTTSASPTALKPRARNDLHHLQAPAGEWPATALDLLLCAAQGRTYLRLPLPARQAHYQHMMQLLYYTNTITSSSSSSSASAAAGGAGASRASASAIHGSTSTAMEEEGEEAEGATQAPREHGPQAPAGAAAAPAPLPAPQAPPAPRRPPPPSIFGQHDFSIDIFEPTVEVNVASAEYHDFAKAVGDFFALGHESATIKRLYNGIFMLMTLPGTKQGMRDERWYLSYLKRLAEGATIMVNAGTVYPIRSTA